MGKRLSLGMVARQPQCTYLYSLGLSVKQSPRGEGHSPEGVFRQLQHIYLHFHSAVHLRISENLMKNCSYPLGRCLIIAQEIASNEDDQETETAVLE
jgi:hypothetical protein